MNCGVSHVRSIIRSDAIPEINCCSWHQEQSVFEIRVTVVSKTIIIVLLMCFRLAVYVFKKILSAIDAHYLKLDVTVYCLMKQGTFRTKRTLCSTLVTWDEVWLLWSYHLQLPCICLWHWIVLLYITSAHVIKTVLANETIYRSRRLSLAVVVLAWLKMMLRKHTFVHVYLFY